MLEENEMQIGRDEWKSNEQDRVKIEEEDEELKRMGRMLTIHRP